MHHTDFTARLVLPAKLVSSFMTKLSYFLKRDKHTLFEMGSRRKHS